MIGEIGAELNPIGFYSMAASRVEIKCRCYTKSF